MNMPWKAVAVPLPTTIKSTSKATAKAASAILPTQGAAAWRGPKTPAINITMPDRARIISGRARIISR